MEKSEQEIIEEIVSSHVVLTRSDGSAIWARKLCISVANEALQKGKEIGFKEKITFLENEIIAIQKTKIAEFQDQLEVRGRIIDAKIKSLDEAHCLLHLAYANLPLDSSVRKKLKEYFERVKI